MQNDNKLFVRIKNLYDPDDVYSLYYILTEENGLYKIVKWTCNNEVLVSEISAEELASDFVPLDNYLTEENLVCKQYLGMGYTYYVLYTFGVANRSNIILHKTFETGNIELEVNGWLSNTRNLENIYDSEIEAWKNPEYLKEQIISHIKNKLKNSNTRKRVNHN